MLKIPDDVSNAGLARLNAALRFVLKAYAEANGGKQPPAKLVEQIKQGIQIKHADLERFGGLSKSKGPALSPSKGPVLSSSKGTA